MATRKPNPISIPVNPLDALTPQQRRESHHYGPIALLHMTGVEPVDEAAQRELRTLIVNHKPGPRWLSRLSGMGSWNVPQIDGAVQLWAGQGSARGDWVRYFRYQLRDEVPPVNMRRLENFGGSESLSANYEAWRWGAVATVLLWAIRNRDVELAALARRWFVVAAALGTLVSVGKDRFPKGEYGRNKRGERLDTSRWMSPVSHRSNLAHAYHPCGVLLDRVLGRRTAMRRPPEWFYKLVDRAAGMALDEIEIEAMEWYLGGPSPKSAERVAELIGKAGVYGSFRVVWWKDTRAVILDQRLNPNTPAIMFEVLNLATGELYLGYPWPSGRAFKAGGQIPTIWERGKGELVAESAYGVARCEVPREDPEMVIVMDERGVRVEERKEG